MSWKPKSFEPESQTNSVELVYGPDGKPLGGLLGGNIPVSEAEAKFQAAKAFLGEETRVWVRGDKVSGPPRFIGGKETY